MTKRSTPSQTAAQLPAALEALRERLALQTLTVLEDGLNSVSAHEVAELPVEKRAKVLIDIVKIHKDLEPKDAALSLPVQLQLEVPPRLTPEQWATWKK